jgi:ribonuclease HIII
MNLKTNIFQNEQFLLDTIAKEQKLKTNVPLIISIDEVGRGCVAGPVLSCVIVKNSPKKKELNALILS